MHKNSEAITVFQTPIPKKERSTGDWTFMWRRVFCSFGEAVCVCSCIEGVTDCSKNSLYHSFVFAEAEDT